jgi:hypothetical protein
MSNSADMFKKLAQNRQKSTSPETAAKTKEESKPAPKSNPPEKAKKTTPEPSSEEKPLAEAIAELVEDIAPEESNKKRGRPATGKRSDPDWIGRTYYVRKETDFDVEDELVKLKRAGVNLDKSELVDFLLAAWVKWRKGENIDIQLSEISPRRKDELS